MEITIMYTKSLTKKLFLLFISYSLVIKHKLGYYCLLNFDFLCSLSSYNQKLLQPISVINEKKIYEKRIKQAITLYVRLNTKNGK